VNTRRLANDTSKMKEMEAPARAQTTAELREAGLCHDHWDVDVKHHLVHVGLRKELEFYDQQTRVF
jgi:hypothetical protein